MKAEREMFEAWCHIDDEFCTHRYTDNCQEYSDDYTQSAWLAWQASAQREGYKLVPVEPPEGMDMKICDLVNHRVDVFEADRIYKAMIEAGDNEQDDYWVLVDEFEAMIGLRNDH